ncbi:MAG: type IV secretion system DNA-binding domain-containing protein [candidate division Zixibacteria bacterium]|nr:type IV secretion system DNA-binding domain-containing protein [candidate division Zixibacteria bacterium]
MRKFHSYVVGLTGRGKSKFLQNCLVQDILAGRGCAIIDPHGDLAKDVLRSLISAGYFQDKHAIENVIYVAPRRRDFILPFNVLKRPDKDTETYEVAQRVIAAFMRTWAKTLAEPPRFQQIMRSSLATLIESGDTLCSLYRLLTDDDFREEKLSSITDLKVAADCQAFFYNEFEQWGRERAHMIASTTNKVSALTDNPSIFYMLGQSENRLDIRKIMDAGKVLLVDLGDCDHETKRLFGTLIVTGFEHAALSRARAPVESRRPYYLYIDEFQDFACHPGAAETFSQMLSQVRKFGLHMILANQSIAQLTPGLQTALGNAQTILSFRISRADAEALARVLGQVNPQFIKHASQTETQHPVYAPLYEQWEQFIQQLTRLQVRQVVVKTADDRQAVIWPEKISDSACSEEQLEIIIRKLLRQHGSPFDQVYRDLVTKPKSKPQDDLFTD